MSTNIDYLTEDSMLPSNQKFVCISFLSDVNNKSTLCGIKIRGCFEKYEEACAHAKQIQSVDPCFNVFVGECGKWLPYNPNPESDKVKSSEYPNDELNKIMKGYLENQEKAKLFHEQRKNEMIRQSIIDNINTINTNIKDIQSLNNDDNKDDNNDNKDDNNDDNNDDTDEKKINDNPQIQMYMEQIKKLESDKESLDEQIELISKQLKAFSETSIPEIFSKN